jgi:hypothetical protein
MKGQTHLGRLLGGRGLGSQRRRSDLASTLWCLQENKSVTIAVFPLAVIEEGGFQMQDWSLPLRSIHCARSRAVKQTCSSNSKANISVSQRMPLPCQSCSVEAVMP